MVDVRRKEWFEHGSMPPFKPNINVNWKLFLLLIPVLLALWLATGIYIVQPGEQAVVRRFGKVSRTTGPGPHFHIPQPIEKVDKVAVEKIRRIEIGFRTIDPGPPARYKFVPAESHMLTGDEQIVDAQAIVQYKVRDPAKFLFNVRNLDTPSGALTDAAEVSLRQVVGQRPIDDVLIGEKLQIEIDIREFLQNVIDGYDSGLRVIEVKLQTVQPPKEVASAFSDVVSAKEDKDTLIKNADGYREDLLPRARGQAVQIIREAEAYKEERIKRSQGDADRFLVVLNEYSKAKDVTRKRMYLETMERIMPDIKKFIIDPDTGGNMLQFLPLDKGGDK
ncbi:MAG: FtsH protease activity modulator HflK [Phycisphaerae bacterium]|nr:FtsH protease activity modulator HflK [Phycisphaerae bacterium]